MNKESLSKYFIITNFNNNFSILQVLLLLLLGSILTLSYHPFDVFIAIPFSLTLLLFLLESKTTLKSKFIAGVIFGYGHFLSSLYWIIYALLIDVSHFGWMVPLVLIIIPLILACFIGLLVVVSEYFNYNKIAYVLGFSTLWVAFEFLRSFFLFPFPWNLLGYASLASENISQFASVVGVYGMSFLLCMFSTCFYSKNYKFIAIVSIVFCAIYVYGYHILENAKVEYVEGYTLRLVQPNLDEHHMGNPQKQEKDLITLINLSFKEPKDNTIFIWPEATFPYLLSDTSSLIPFLSTLLPKNSFLITGADWLNWNNRINEWEVYNSIISINKKADILSLYHKTILLPFGEYIPLRKLFPDVIKIIAYGIGDFKPGKLYPITKLNEQLPPIVNLICSEAIFTHLPYMYSSKSYGMLLNLTNDTWFGDSIGPYQHYNMARMRAIEYSTPLIRVAKHGISAVFDQYGKVLKSLPLGQQGVINSKIPKKTLQSSFYQLYYHTIMIFLTLLFICLSILKNINHEN